MSDGVSCMWMRGGTSKGAYFLADDLPGDIKERDSFLLSVMGSPDIRQVDGLGGGDTLTSKVAVVRKSDRPGVDVDYLFLQVMVDQPIVTDAQNCGNILAGVGPFSIERGLVKAKEGQTDVRIFMKNTGQIAVASVATPHGRVNYRGEARIDGVPGSHAAIPLAFEDIEGASCSALLPTGNAGDRINDIDCTLIDNGMPCVILRASDFGLQGNEEPQALEDDKALCSRIEAIRLIAGEMMNLGDVTDETVPKMTLVSPATNGGTISTRTFIPHRCHKAIGVFGATSVATACLIPGSIAAEMAVINGGRKKTVSVEHPTGEMTVLATVEDRQVISTAVLRTARNIMDGVVFATELVDV